MAQRYTENSFNFLIGLLRWGKAVVPCGKAPITKEKGLEERVIKSSLLILDLREDKLYYVEKEEESKIFHKLQSSIHKETTKTNFSRYVPVLSFCKYGATGALKATPLHLGHRCSQSCIKNSIIIIITYRTH